MNVPIYMDNHATTRVDPRVLEAMLPFFGQAFGNPGSASHSFGQEAKRAVDAARQSIAEAIGASPREIVFTSGATESNNLAIRGLADRPRRKGSHIVSAATEHRAILDPLRRLARQGFEVTLLPVEQRDSPRAGWLAPERIAEAIRDDTLLVTVMLANNEIGVIQPLAEISAICRERGVPLHSDATQAVGKLPVDVVQLGVDLMSFSGHKIYGPKGIGVLYVRRGEGAPRLVPLVDGGGQEGGLRSGTLNVPGIVGLARALELCIAKLPEETRRLAALRQRLWDGLRREVPETILNGPDWQAVSCPHPLREKAQHAPPHPSPTLSHHQSTLRLPGNLNCAFPGVDGEALMMNARDVAVSSGSACTSASPEPSHVLRALGLSDDLVRASLRFGLGRFNTEEEVDYTVATLSRTVKRLLSLTGEAAIPAG
jgi:cysteine desulfurase